MKLLEIQSSVRFHQDFSAPAMERLSLALADSDRLQRLLNPILPHHSR